MHFTKSLEQWAVGAAFALLAGTASAAPLTLSGPITGNAVGPQSASAPCVIAGTNCSNPANFGYNNFTSTGAISSYNMYSTTPTATVADGVQGTPYTVGQLLTLFPTGEFDIAIDINTTNKNSETLNLFEVIINGAVAYDYVGPTALAPVNNNGNGYADWLLQTVSLDAYLSTATVLFHAVWSGAVDGAESFFLVASGSSPPTGIPEPATLALVGLALVGLGAGRRARKA